jgi:hypothetical protein
MDGETIIHTMWKDVFGYTHIKTDIKWQPRVKNSYVYFTVTCQLANITAFGKLNDKQMTPVLNRGACRRGVLRHRLASTVFFAVLLTLRRGK